MATYSELRALFNDPDTALKGKVEVAVIVAAEGISGEAPATENHAARLLWAARALSNPSGEAEKAYMAVLAANKDAATTAIKVAADTAIQTNVDAVVDTLAGV